jgi:hypothetical protein
MMPNQKTQTSVGDCWFSYQANQMPHLSVGGMSTLFGGESANLSAASPYKLIHQPLHCDGNYHGETIMML